MRSMAMTPEYEQALDALSQAADAMTRACNGYEIAKAFAGEAEPASEEMEAIRKACNDARNAHDEALADAWELIEEQPA